MIEKFTMFNTRYSAFNIIKYWISLPIAPSSGYGTPSQGGFSSQGGLGGQSSGFGGKYQLLYTQKTVFFSIILHKLILSKTNEKNVFSPFIKMFKLI